MCEIETHIRIQIHIQIETLRRRERESIELTMFFLENKTSKRAQSEKFCVAK